MAKRIIKILGIIFGIFLLLFLIVPFLIRIPILKDVVSPEQLADADSKFIQVNGLNVHYKIYGQGEPVIVLLHGFGASLFSWREVTGPLSKLGAVIAYDRPAFGLTERPCPAGRMSAGILGFGCVIHARIKLDGGEMGKNIEIGTPAPNFALIDIKENEIHLSDYEGKKTVILSLIRGFA